ncbi:C2 domain-containing protein-like [Zostera marina]|uniref:C2 domain-containing protein-like n=1 Tax=Zostera marina TaxID=29655 RepID=A0A0K9PPG4_ZOSMR|nr:C2 domain-containing protein-like [Zostera marina]
MFRSGTGRRTGQLKVRIIRGYNLAIRDIRSSDPYVVVKHNGSKQKTQVIKNNVNPEWNEDLKFSNLSPFEAVKITVFDKDRFSRDDSMGDAVVDILPLMEAAEMNSDDIPEDNSIVRTVMPNGINRLSTDSHVYWVDGKIIQDVVVRLNNVECGELELQLQWAKRS